MTSIAFSSLTHFHVSGILKGSSSALTSGRGFSFLIFPSLISLSFSSCI
ncbi:MAG: hypothetical protein II014_02835 [Bifidobacteriaceae bacterium]|nr:hypothetical protein [Bifidobacteriaceae bacterium]